MSTRSLEEVLKEITAVTKVAEQDADLLPYATRAAHSMAINEARDRLPVLQEEYKSGLLAGTSVFFVKGPDDKIKHFIKETSKVVPAAFVADPSEVYNTLSAKVEETMGGSREFSGNQLAALIHAQRELARLEGLPKPDMPELTELRSCSDAADTVSYIRDLVRKSSGDKTAFLYIRNKFAAQAVAKASTGPSFLLIVNATAEERQGLAEYFPKVRSLSLSEETEIDESFVIKVFEQQEAPKKLPRNKKNNTQEQ